MINEPVEYPADQAVREQLQLLRQISKSTQTTATILTIFAVLLVLGFVLSIVAANA